MALPENLSIEQLKAIADYGEAIESGSLSISRPISAPTIPEQGGQSNGRDSEIARLIGIAGPPNISQEEPETTVSGLAASAARGAAPVAGTAAIGAGIGAGIGALAGGVGAIPGAAIGAQIGAAVPAIGDLGVAGINALFKTNYSGPTDAWQHLLTAIGVPEAKTQAERILQATVSAGAGSGGLAKGAGQLAKVASGRTEKVLSFLADKPMQQAVSGAAGGAASELAKEEGYGAGGQLAAGILGGLAGGGVTASIKPGIVANFAKKIGQAERIGLSPRTSDVFPPKTMPGKFMQTTGESIPLTGTGRQLARQQEQKIKAIESLAAEFDVDLANPSLARVFTDLTETRGAELKYFTKQKRDVIEGLSSTAKPVAPRHSVKALDFWIDKLQGISGEHDSLVARLRGFRDDLLNPSINEAGEQFYAGKTLEQVEGIRKLIGQVLTDPTLASVREAGKEAISPIYAAINRDMGEFILNNAGRDAFKKWKEANGRLQLMMGELKKSTLSSVLKSGDATPEKVRALLFSTTPSDARALYANLDNLGKAHARTAIIEEAIKKSIDANDMISPAKFLSETRRLGNSIGVFFKGEDLERLKGLTESLAMLRRSGEFAVNSPTGVQTRIPNLLQTFLSAAGAAGASAKFGAPETIASILTVGAITRFYESKAVRNLLIDMASVKGEVSKQAILQNLAREAAKIVDQEAEANKSK